MTESVIRVLVADDHASVRTGIRHVLETEPGFTVVGEASNGTEALALALELRPDVAVLDISMPGVSGLHAASELRRRSPETRVLILSMHDAPELMEAALASGARAYLLKHDLRQLIDAVRSIQVRSIQV